MSEITSTGLFEHFVRFLSKHDTSCREKFVQPKAVVLMLGAFRSAEERNSFCWTATAFADLEYSTRGQQLQFCRDCFPDRRKSDGATNTNVKKSCCLAARGNEMGSYGNEANILVPVLLSNVAQRLGTPWRMRADEIQGVELSGVLT